MKPELDFLTNAELKELIGPAKRVKQIADTFNKPFREKRDAMEEHIFDDYDAVIIAPVDDAMATEISQYGTKIRFDTRLALDEKLNVVAVVLCHLIHHLRGKAEYLLLGEITVSTKNGQTDLITSQGKACVLPTETDVVISHFLKAAHRQNLTLLA